MRKSKNDLEWEKLFGEHNILDSVLTNGCVKISASQINEYREARLMTKFDHKSQLPKLFTDHNLSILPISRGDYVIGNFETFCAFNTDNIAVSSVEFPVYLESLDYQNINSEATAINCAYVSNILKDFTQDQNLLPTVNGRMSSSSFAFNINSLQGQCKIDVNNSQIEIDGGYEGDCALYLIEAKNYISDDFLIRQLYYPFKLWSNKIRKKVRPIFLTYTNGVFHLREYKFTDTDHYNSLILVQQKKYVIREGGFNHEVLAKIIDTTPIVNQPAIPFPQADKFERVINLCELLQEKEQMAKEDITRNYDFDARQTDYYCNAGKYLGLIDIITIREKPYCVLTNKGKQVFHCNLVERQKEFIKLIIAHSVFKKTLQFYLDNGKEPYKEVIIEIMKSEKLYNVSSLETYRRRASTVISWVNWIICQLEE